MPPPLSGAFVTSHPRALPRLWAAYRQRLRRRALRWRAFRARHQLRLVQDNRRAITRDDILLVCVFRNEALRLPWFLEYYRQRGVNHFLLVDNDSEDGSAELLRGAADVTLWHSTASYRASRFGMDWANWLLRRYGRGHWCLTVDVDELLVQSDQDRRSLRDLTLWLEQRGQRALGALMLDLFPKGPLDAGDYAPGQDPTEVIGWFDPGPFWQVRQAGLDNLWVQGGTRARAFFADAPQRAPTLNKLPLVRWRRGDVYVNSTHSMRPTALNHVYDGPEGRSPAAVLLHSKFLPDSAARAARARAEGEHFGNPAEFAPYYQTLIDGPDIWHSNALLYKNWKQLYDLGLIRPENLD